MGIVEGLRNEIIPRINSIIRCIDSIVFFINAMNLPSKVLRIINRSVNTSGGQLAASGLQVDRPNLSSVPIRPLPHW